MPSFGDECQERLDQSPFGICQVGHVAQVIAAMLPSGGWRPHAGSRGLRYVLESAKLQPAQPIPDGSSDPIPGPWVARKERFSELLSSGIEKALTFLGRGPPRVPQHSTGAHLPEGLPHV